MSGENGNKRLFVSSSPHVHGPESVPRIMFSVILALLPAALTGVYFFGLPALFVLLLSTGSAMAAEAMMQKIMGRKITLTDGSAALTGLLLGMTLPPSSPWWMALAGGFIAIVLGKQIYGGLGHNLFNPALVARVVLLISWPVQMTSWVRPTPLFGRVTDAVSMASPLGVLKVEGAAKIAAVNLLDCFFGNVPGSIGEVSVLALLIGGVFLLWREYITWHIPLSFLGTVALLSSLFWLGNPAQYASPVFHLVNGGLMLGAFFMATDYVTSPVTGKGRVVFGIGCGLITVLIRVFGVYPEGVAFAILLMNAFTPLIDRYTKPEPFGMRGAGGR